MDAAELYRIDQQLAALELEQDWEPFLLREIPNNPQLRERMLDRRRRLLDTATPTGEASPHAVS